MYLATDLITVPFPAQGGVTSRRYELAYAYRMVNTREVDEYVERVNVRLELDMSRPSQGWWTLTLKPDLIEYVGSPGATRFFKAHETQILSLPQFVFTSDEQGVVDSSRYEASTLTPITNGHTALLMADIRGTYPGAYRIREHVLPQHFGGIDLPLLETLTASSTATGYQIQIDGKVDRSKFDQANFSQFVKNMIDVHDLRTRVDLTHEITYLLDKNGLIDQVDAYTETEVANAYNITFARTLKKVD
ncbi:hypothetical protein [uncultured Fibrella sp.]|uniref:hypothetical protein n=1 Tax=uncultured Fibrella sp. TaxID=1284596 RepID=UPI0035C9E5C5